jgi:hypothetical protein
LESGEVFEGAVIDAGWRGFITDQELEDLAPVGQFLENEPKASDAVNFGKLFVDVFFGVDDFVIEDGGFEGGDAAKAPAGYGEGADELAFDPVVGPEKGFVGFEELVEVFLGIVRQGRIERGAEAVFAGVLGGAGFAFAGDGSAGFRAVGAGGVGSGLRCHAY